MELLVCPLCKGPLTYEHTSRELCCAADRLAFPVRDGIAVMLEHEARAIDPPAEPAPPVLAGQNPADTAPAAAPDTPPADPT